MKYVVLHHPTKGLAIVAGLFLDHAQMAGAFAAAGYVPQSAGFIRWLPGERFEAFGHSESLKLASHSDDARLLSAFYSATLKTAVV